MLLYSSQVTARLQYIAEFFSKQLLNQEITVTSDKDQFRNHNGAKINYSPSAITADEFRIDHVDLLFETGIQIQSVRCFETNGYKAFFRITGSDFPFDIFAAAFYLISRYEEYLPHHKDKYGRYAHTNSLAWRESFLHLPLVNIWLNDFKKALQRKFADPGFKNGRFTYIPTYDIDMAYSYRHKGAWRNIGGFVRSMLKGEWRTLGDRLLVLMDKKRDPFDSFEWLDTLHLKYRLTPCYFFLLALSRTAYDKNIPPSNDVFGKLVECLSANYKTGIHPSWKSSDREQILKKEVGLLEYLSHKKVKRSRQHFLRFSLPETYRSLLRVGIEKEYSMGYGTVNGFRASASSSFYWYDLQKEKTTSLIIYPFCFMDANAFYAQKNTPEQALEELMAYYESVKNVDGLMVTIWHNNFLGTDPQFAGWKEVYESFLKQIHDQNNDV